MLLPAIEMAEPMETSSAPAAPRKIAAPSANGVRLAPRSGSTPVATSDVSDITTDTVMSVATNANGTSRLGLAASPASTPVTS